MIKWCYNLLGKSKGRSRFSSDFAQAFFATLRDHSFHILCGQKVHNLVPDPLQDNLQHKNQMAGSLLGSLALSNFSYLFCF